MNYPVLVRRLTGTQKGKDEHLHTQELSLGTGPNNTIRFDPTWDRGVSASHARIWLDEGGAWQLQDAGSSTGTFINGQRITMKRQVGGSFVLELGQGGPKVEITLPGEMPHGAAAPGVRPGAARAPSSGGGMKWLALAACVGVLGAGAWFFMNKGAMGGDSDSKLETVAKRLESAVGKVLYIDAEGRPSGSGTAWAVAPGIF
ncbi:MAG: FHA domain-containing protein, partial [Verrucomicrobiaceae bacterium]|nr:FHA domain-containing protein [Verrucomicrobiaceae bacterium]